MTDIDHRQYEAEAKARWGDTDAHRESTKRTKGYSDADWVKIKAEVESIEAGFADAMASGEVPTGDQALDLAEQARAHIDRWYYPCSATVHASLADMYTADERFKAHYDERADGLADYVVAAIKANLACHGA